MSELSGNISGNMSSNASSNYQITGTISRKKKFGADDQYNDYIPRNGRPRLDAHGDPLPDVRYMECPPTPHHKSTC